MYLKANSMASNQPSVASVCRARPSNCGVILLKVPQVAKLFKRKLILLSLSESVRQHHIHNVCYLARHGGLQQLL